MEQLQQHFTAACDALGSWEYSGSSSTPPDSDAAAVRAAVWADIVTRHQEPHRAYHTLDHLAAMMAWLVRAYAPDPVPAPTVFSVLFHDCVYDPKRQDNEEVSARVAAGHLQSLAAPPALRQQVCAYIFATVAHVPPAGPPDSHLLLFLDADLSVLAQPWEVYQVYAAGVRREYRHVEEQDFRAGRAAVLRRLLGKPQLYFSVQAHDLGMEAAARANLTAELLQLG